MTYFRVNSFGADGSQVAGIIFAIIHYNRVETLVKALGSVLGQLRSGDCLIMIDNGSPVKAQSQAEKILLNATHKLNHQIRVVYAATHCNQGGVAAYSWLLNYLLGGAIPNATHLVLLGDDDLLLPGWRSQVEGHITSNSWVAWGFDYFNWITKKVEKHFAHSCHIERISGENAHKQWLGSIAGILPSCGRQEHPSAVAISLKSLRQARLNLATIVPLPYGDVGLALIIAFADTLICLDQSLGLIGRGNNYGMGSADRMAANHPTRRRIAGRPSHSKYAAATYVECLLLIGREDLIGESTKLLIANHLVSTYGTTFRTAIKVFWSKPGKRLVAAFVQTLEDVVLLASLRGTSSWPWFYDRVVLWALGITRLFSLRSLSQIRINFIDRLV